MAVQVTDWLDAMEKALEGRAPDVIRSIEILTVELNNQGGWWMEAEITYKDGTSVRLI